MVDLVQDHERLPGLSACSMQQRLVRNLRVCHRNADEAAAVAAIGVLEIRVNREPDAGGSVSPLRLQVLGRGYNSDAVDGAALNQGLGYTQRERCFTCAWGCYCKEVLLWAVEERFKSLRLPLP